MSFPIEVSCPCGQVHYRLLKAPKKVMACHCKACQALSSAPFSVTAIVAREDVQFGGDMASTQRVAESGNVNQGYFCTGCGVRIYHWNPEQPDIIKLKLKPTDSSVADYFTPQAHIWVGEKAPWFTLPDNVPTFVKQA